jgi:MSHA biogenesis protein MshO
VSAKRCQLATRKLATGKIRAASDPILASLPKASGQSANAPTRGFTLIELVIAISLAGIVVTFAAMFIIVPVKSYQSQARRAELVDSADAVLRLVGRDVRAALPNSIRVTTNGSVVALEMLSAVDAVRYRDSGATADPTQELDFSSPDGSFASLSQFDGITRPFTTTTSYLSIYNVGVPGADAYSLSNVITPAGTTITIDNSATAGEDLITMSPAFRFAYGSPGHRVYLVSGPVTYLCDQTANTIRRYSGYSIAANQSSRDSAGELNAAGATSSAVANNITACQFDYTPGTAQRAGLVTLRITINKAGESIWLVHQVHVENAP